MGFNSGFKGLKGTLCLHLQCLDPKEAFLGHADLEHLKTLISKYISKLLELLLTLLRHTRKHHDPPKL